MRGTRTQERRRYSEREGKEKAGGEVGEGHWERGTE